MAGSTRATKSSASRSQKRSRPEKPADDEARMNRIQETPAEIRQPDGESADKDHRRPSDTSTVIERALRDMPSDDDTSTSSDDGQEMENMARRLMEEKIAFGSKRRKIVHVEHIDQVIKPTRDRNLHESRFRFLLYFNDTFGQLLAEELVDDTLPVAWVQSLYGQTKANCRNWKCETKKHAIDFARKIQEQNTPDDEGEFGMCRDHDSLSGYFSRKVTAELFLRIFSWLKHDLDWEGSTRRGRFFMKNVFGNFMARAVLLVRAEIAQDSNPEYSKEALGNAFDQLALNPQWRVMQLTDFARLSQPVKDDRRRKRRAAVVRNVILGTMPSAD